MARVTKKPQTHIQRSGAVGETARVDAESIPTKPSDEAATLTSDRVRHEGALPPQANEIQHTGASVSVRSTVLTDKDLTQLRPGVAELYGTYGIGKRLGRSRERLMTWTGFLQGKLESATGPDGAKPTAKDVAKFATDNDLRRQIFLLEGLLKLYDGPMPELKISYAKIKMLEDTLGDVSAALDLKETCDPIANLPAHTKQYVESNIADAQGKLENVFSGKLDDAQLKELREIAGLGPDDDVGALGFMPGDNGQIPAFGEMLELMANADWPSYKKDRKFLKAELKTRLDEIDDTDYDMSDLQGATGLHEFRRDLRWLPIYTEALDGLVELTDKHNPIKEYENLLITDPNDPNFVSDLSTSKFTRLPDSSLEKKPIKVSLSMYTANMQGVLDFGKLKDRGEAIENVGHALVHGGDAKDLDEGMAMAMKMLGQPTDAFDGIVAEAQVLYDKIVMTDLIDELEDEFK